MNGSTPISHFLPDALRFSQLHGVELVFLLGLILFFGSLGGRLFQKLKIPQVVGYIVIGIIIGSSGLRILGEQTILALNPISTIALSFIGFLVGAELKLGVIKKYGKQFIGILLGESITPFFVVGFLVTAVCFSFTHNFNTSLAMGLVLGAICSATAPAATTDVLKEYRTKGPLTTTVLGIVAMDDAVALILYAIAATIASSLLGQKQISFVHQLISIAKDIFGSILLGGLCGFLISVVIKNVMEDEGRVLSFSLGGIFLATGLCEFLGMDNILCAMSIGFFVINFAPKKIRPLFKFVERYTPPVYVLFFVLVGAKLNVWVVTPLLALIALLYVLGRTGGKALGSWLGAKITGAPATVRRYLPLCLLSQAGVAIGLSIAASNDFPESIGPQIVLIITATTFIVQVVGPICVRAGVMRAGEVGLNITEEDILKRTKVGDVTWGSEKIANEKSFAVVSELESAKEIIERFEQGHYKNFAVKSSAGALCGFITLEHLKETLFLGDVAALSMLALDIMEMPLCTCTPEDSLPEVYKKFSQFDTDGMPIVSKEGKPLGVLEKFAVDHYVHTRLGELNQTVENLEK